MGKLKPIKLWQAHRVFLLALLVGLNLTLVCQGHDHGPYHVGLHITFLGEFRPSGHIAHSQIMGEMDAHGMAAPSTAQFDGPSKPAYGPVYSPTTGLEVGAGTSLLLLWPSAVLTGFLYWAYWLRLLFCRLGWRPAAPPEAPPPR